MKKILSILLVLVVLAAGSACAETLSLEPGTPSACAPDLFMQFFTFLSGSSGYTFTWEDGTGTEGAYTVNTGASEDGTMNVMVYSADGGVVYGKGSGTIPLTLSDSAGAERFGEWFGAASAGMIYSFLFGEKGAGVINDDPELANRISAEYSSLVSRLQSRLSSDEAMKDGIAVTGTVAGYPAGVEVLGVPDGSTMMVTIHIYVSSSDGTLTVQ